MIGVDRFAAGLPWGWWLRLTGSALEDEHGLRWNSVRDAYWRGRLGFPVSHFADEQQELLFRTLCAIDARGSRDPIRAGVERKGDLFNGDMLFVHFHKSWMAAVGLLDMECRSHAFEAPLSAEGRAVMLMLAATRQPEWEGVPLRDVVDAVAAAARGPAGELREQALGRFERQVGMRRYVFARESVGRSYLVTLTGIATGARMPTRRVMWSQTFADVDARDDLFAWFAQRVDCWDAWGGMAYRKGADVFTSHLLTLIVGAGGLAN